MGSDRFCFGLVPDAGAPRRARRVLESHPAIGDPDLLFVLRLLVSELVANSVRHGRGRIRVDVMLGDGVARVVVRDGGEGLSLPPPLPRERHRGLALVDALADRWGYTRGRPARVWFELACDAAGRPVNFDARLTQLAESVLADAFESG